MAAIGTEADSVWRYGAPPTRTSSPRRLSSADDGDRVDRLAPAVEVDHRVEDGLVRRAVEVGAADRLDHVGDGVLGEQHRAEHGLLGVVVLGRHPVAAVPAAVAGPPSDRHEPNPDRRSRRVPRAPGHRRPSRSAGLLGHAHPLSLSVATEDGRDHHRQCGNGARTDARRTPDADA